MIDATVVEENPMTGTDPIVETQSIAEADPTAVALVYGQSVDMPRDLYIPPDALKIFLEAFEGPLDLLLYLIKKQNIDILDLPIAEITKQYMSYVELMHELHFELAAEYLLMAAMLAEIKSRMLLPRQASVEEEEVDPRADLIRRLQEYERFKKAAEHMDTLPREGRDVFGAQAEKPDLEVKQPEPHVDLKDLVFALQTIMKRAEQNKHHQIKFEMLSVRDRMSQVLQSINPDAFTEFTRLFSVKEGRLGVVVTFLALLELLKQAMIELVQNEPFSPIYVKSIAGPVQ